MKTFFVVVSLTLFLTACGQSDEPLRSRPLLPAEVSEAPMVKVAAPAS